MEDKEIYEHLAKELLDNETSSIWHFVDLGAIGIPKLPSGEDSMFVLVRFYKKGEFTAQETRETVEINLKQDTL